MYHVFFSGYPAFGFHQDLETAHKFVYYFTFSHFFFFFVFWQKKKMQK